MDPPYDHNKFASTRWTVYTKNPEPK